MSTPRDAEFLRRADQLHGRYRYLFAGKPRATRPLDQMDGLIRDIEALAADATTSGASQDARTTIDERRDLYVKERDAIRSARALGPSFVRGTELSTRARLVFDQYGRHFAGQSRRTRDVALLVELIGELETIEHELGGIMEDLDASNLADDLQSVRTSIGQYRDEVDAIHAARADADAESLMSDLARTANSQFSIYRTHFAGKDRLSRRPALLRRVVTTLEELEASMKKLQADLSGEPAETNARNAGIVADRLTSYRAESNEIGRVRESTTPESLIAALGRAANAIMDEYNGHFAGQDRATRDLGLLGDLIDRLWQIEQQMNGLDRALAEPTNARNLQIVHDTMQVYIAEHAAIVEVQGGDDA